MKRIILLLFILISARSFSQTVYLRPGDPAPNLIITMEGNSIQSFVMPYMRNIILLHYWSSANITSKIYGKRLNKLAKRYKNVVYKNAANFEVIAIAAQNNRKAWRDDIHNDSLSEFTNGIALNGLDDEACKKYGVVSLPTDILIDENGRILAIDPKITTLEDILDERKNFQPVKKEVIGTLAQSSNKSEVVKYSKLYLFNHYGDSLGKTTTDKNGNFTFDNIKLNQDFILKVDNKTDILTSDPIAIYIRDGDCLMNGVTSENGFIFYIPSRINYRLTDSERKGGGSQFNVVKNIEFTQEGDSLTEKDKKELSFVLSQLEKSKNTCIDFTTNTDSKLSDAQAMALTVKQMNTLTDYFEKKGITKDRLSGIAKGSEEPRIICDQSHPCEEEQHQENRRVEFFIHKY